MLVDSCDVRYCKGCCRNLSGSQTLGSEQVRLLYMLVAGTNGTRPNLSGKCCKVVLLGMLYWLLMVQRPLYQISKLCVDFHSRDGRLRRKAHTGQTRTYPRRSGLCINLRELHRFRTSLYALKVALICHKRSVTVQVRHSRHSRAVLDQSQVGAQHTAITANMILCRIQTNDHAVLANYLPSKSPLGAFVVCLFC